MEHFHYRLNCDSKPYQALPGCVAYALHNPFKERLEWLQQQDIITLLCVDETAEWCNSFMLVLKPNGKDKLCLHLARLNQTIIRPVHRESICNDILPKLNNLQYLSFIDASSGYHNLKLDERSSYLTTFAWQSG